MKQWDTTKGLHGGIPFLKEIFSSASALQVFEGPCSLVPGCDDLAQKLFSLIR